MKEVLFILLVFISFNGFSQTQTVKLKEIGLEVMKEDLSNMKWKKAINACKKLGDGWRLPTMKELEEIYKYKDEIGGFETSENGHYWSSTEKSDITAWTFYMVTGNAPNIVNKEEKCYVRAVRNLK